MRLISLMPAALSLFAAIPAQAAAYRCTDAAGAVVFQDQPCSTGPSVRLRAVPGASQPEQPGALERGAEGEELLARPSASGQDNVREYLDARERERQQLRGEQRRAFAGEEERQRRASALSKIEERLRALALQKASLAADSQERNQALYNERLLQRLRGRIEAGSPGAVEEANALR